MSAGFKTFFLVILTFAFCCPAISAQNEQFGTPQQIFSDTSCCYAYSYSVGDVNEDGRTDVVLGLSGCMQLPGNVCTYYELLEQNADGSFTASPIPMGNATHQNNVNGPLYVTLVDVNGDGHLDLVAIPGGNFNSAEVYLGDGKGHFTYNQDLTIFPSGVNSVLIRDFNGDGHPDIAVLSGGDFDSYLTIYLNQGDGTFSKKETVSLVGSWEDFLGQGHNIVAGDFTGNGKVDLAFTGDPGQSPTSGAVDVVAGDGTGNFTQDYIYSFSSVINAIAAADLNNDGKTELVAALESTGKKGSLPRVAVLTPDHEGRLYWANAVYSNDSITAIGLADLNGDGKLDVAGEVSDGLAVLNGEGGYNFSQPQLFPYVLQDDSARPIVAAPLVKGAKPSLFYRGGNGFFVLPNETK